MMSQIANGLQVPQISFAATDPTLSALQFPFFLRTTHSDSYQMAAMADLIDFYGWKEVIVIFVDDDYGRNGIAALDDELDKRGSKISYKLSLPTEFNVTDFTEMLNKSKLIGPRVYVVHVNPDPSFRIFTVAQKLQMMTRGYVWFATDWLCATLDSFSPMNQTSLRFLQGVVGLRQHIPQSRKKDAFVSQWRKMQKKGLVNSGLNTYGLYAYDTVWALAYSIDEFLKNQGKVSFSASDRLLDIRATQLEKLEIFDSGDLLLRQLLQINFTGLTGQIQFDSERNLINASYEVINIVQTTIRGLGYWSNYSGLSVLPPEDVKSEQKRDSFQDQKLGNVTWPGGITEKPRGWEIAADERPLRIGIPRRASFVEFVTELNTSHKVQGYCIDVFNEALKLVPYNVPHTFIPYGDGQSNPNYGELVQMVANDVSENSLLSVS